MLLLDFVGVSSSGKTTVMEEVKNSLERSGRTVHIVSSVSRSLAEVGIGTSESTTVMVQAYISIVNWMNILDAAQKYDIVLTTDLGIRSTAYLLQMEKAIDVDKLDYPLYDTLLSTHFQFIKLIGSSLFSGVKVLRFYIPVEFALVPDAVRSENKEYENGVDLAILKILKNFKIQYTQLTGTVVERTNTALAVIEGYFQS